MKFSFDRRVGLGGDITLLTFGDKATHVGMEPRPRGVTLKDVAHATIARMARELATMCFLKNAVD